jgi:deazaflavin-dependent oxidoreductase (nitroreductase family)
MCSPQLTRGRAARPVAYWMVGYLLLALLLVFFTHRDRVLNQLRFFHRRIVNPFTLRFAGRTGASRAVIQHVGRTSGKPYRTPVLAIPVKDGFVIPLTFGTHVDWLRNIQAAGGATLTWNGRDYLFKEPTVIDAATARTLLPPLKQWISRLLGIAYFLRVGCPAEKPDEAPSEAAVATPVLV